MKRFIVTPYEWGTTTGYNFLNNDNPNADIVVHPHVSYAAATGVFERSFRIWEPGRMALSSMGVTDPDPDQEFNVPQIPQGCKVHGIKGELVYSSTGVATFYDASTGEELDPQPDYRDIFDPWNGVDTVVDSWNDVYRPGFKQSATSVDPKDPAAWCRAPLYITMYKGTFNPYSNTYVEGASIDSGPNDDPDTLLGVDIVNPTVLEQERIVWWDVAWMTMRHRNLAYLPLRGDTETATAREIAPNFSKWHCPVQRYPLSLDRNWIVKDDQVLWLHIKPGVVDTGFFWQDPLGNAHRVMYKPHFNVDLIASMLATPFTPGR